MNARAVRGGWTRRWNAAIAAALATLVLAVCAGALWFVRATGERLIAAQEREALASELDYLAEVGADEGPERLAQAIERRARLGRPARLYALRRADGAVAAGNTAWPRGLAGQETWRSIQTSEGGAHVATRALAGGAMLLVGRDDTPLRAFNADVQDAVWVAISVVAATCLLIAAGVTGFVLGRVRRLSGVASRVSAGNLSARAEAAGGGPFGEIAAALNAMLDRIETLMTGLRTVTDSLAHDLRTPLTRARGRIEQGVLADGEAAKQRALEDALGEIDRTLATFTALVDIARAEGGLSRASMAELDLAAVLGDIRDLFEPLASERGQTLRLSAAPVRIMAHKPLLMQAVSNLVHNAIKYAPQGDAILIALGASAGQAEICVADHGPGIPAERRADAVQRFKRIAEDAAAPEGLGLGLAIVDACARLHGGALALEDNAPGLRARLTLRR
jgi:signal transduction histidine kinase